jgi:hypothetical protein
MIAIPLFDLASFTEEVILDDVPYRLTFQWNSRGEFWSMSISDSNNILLLSGIKLVINFELISEWHAIDLPAGELYIVDPTGSDAPIAFEDFGNGRLEIVYVSEAERASV